MSGRWRVRACVGCGRTSVWMNNSCGYICLCRRLYAQGNSGTELEDPAKAGESKAPSPLTLPDGGSLEIKASDLVSAGGQDRFQYQVAIARDQLAQQTYSARGMVLHQQVNATPAQFAQQTASANQGSFARQMQHSQDREMAQYQQACSQYEQFNADLAGRVIDAAKKIELEAAKVRITELEAQVAEQAGIIETGGQVAAQGWKRANDLSDMAGELRTSRDELAVENSNLRRKLEAADRKTAKR